MIVDFYIPCINILEETSERNSKFLYDAGDLDISEAYVRTYEYRARHNSLRNIPVSEEGLFSGMKVINDQMILTDADYKYFKATALLLNMNKKAMSEEEYKQMLASGTRMLIVNLDPNSFEGDAETEFNRWLYESKMILSDSTLDGDTCLNSLPVLNFKIRTEDGKGIDLIGCKYVKNYSDKKYPYFFALLIKQTKTVE